MILLKIVLHFQSFDSWTTDRKIVNTGLEFQVDIGSAQNINSPKIFNNSTSNS